MAAQLLYVYIKDIGRCFDQQQFCFTNDFDINYDPDNRKLLISEKSNPFKHLWGERISNINLIVGKNGAGKTTLFDLLGSTKQRRINMYRRQQEEWFAVYHIEHDVFVIEGHGQELIDNIRNIPLGTSNEYSFCIQYDFAAQMANYHTYIQYYRHDVGDENIALNYTLLALYAVNDSRKQWFTGNIVRDESDTYVGFERQYINKPTIYNIYKFVSREYSLLDQDFTAERVVCEMERVEEIFPPDYYRDDQIRAFDLQLYNDKSKILLFMTNLTGLHIYRPDPEKQAEDQWTNKEKFIIKYLESVVADIWMNQLHGALEKRDLRRIAATIAKIDFQTDNFMYRIKYLFEVLQVLIQEINPLIEAEGTVYGGYQMQDIRDYTASLDQIDDDYFDSDEKIVIPINKGYDEYIFRLLQLCDVLMSRGYRFRNTMHITFKHLSAGELEFINVFSNLYSAIDIAQNYDHLESILILLDEPDASFHPEWSRRFVHYLYRFLNHVQFERQLKYQVLISTHSPFIVSDVPKEHITCINVFKDERNGELRRVVSRAEFGLMSNFYDIIQNDFFITSPIGEHAKYLFDQLIERIESLNDYHSREIGQLKGIIGGIGEEVIRKKLMQLLSEKEIQLMPDADRGRRIAELEEELRRLRGEQGRGRHD